MALDFLFSFLPMETSLFLLQLFGLCFVLAGAAEILHPAQVKRVANLFVEDSAHRFLGGMASFAIGAAIVLGLWNFSSLAGALVSLIGLVSAIKGLLLVLYPRPFELLIKQLVEKMFFAVGVATVVVGLALLYVGFCG